MNFTFLTKILLALLLLVNFTNAQPQKAPWANIWSQSYVSHNTETQQYTTGTIWYDYTLPAMRYDFANALVVDDCRQLMQENTPCTFLVISRLLFVIYSEKRLCGNFGIIVDVPAPDQVVQFSSYLQTKTINGKQYILWNNTGYAYRNYMTTTGQKQIYYKQIFTEGNITMTDYIVNSYVQKVNSKVFDLPKYCYQNPMQINQELKQNILKNMKKNFQIKEIKISEN